MFRQIGAIIAIVAGIGTMLLGGQKYIESQIEKHVTEASHGGKTTKPEIELTSCMTVNTGSTEECQAKCSADKVVISGGCEVKDANSVYSQVFISAPNAQRDGWICKVSGNQNEERPQVRAKAYAFCADADLRDRVY